MLYDIIYCYYVYAILLNCYLAIMIMINDYDL